MFFLTRLLEKKKEEEEDRGFMTFLLWRAEETEVTLGWRASLDLGCIHSRATITIMWIVQSNHHSFLQHPVQSRHANL